MYIYVHQALPFVCNMTVVLMRAYFAMLSSLNAYKTVTFTSIHFSNTRTHVVSLKSCSCNWHPQRETCASITAVVQFEFCHRICIASVYVKGYVPHQSSSLYSACTVFTYTQDIQVRIYPLFMPDDIQVIVMSSLCASIIR